MSDPHAAAQGVIYGAGISTAGFLLGAQVDALAVGLVAAILMTINMNRIDSMTKAASSVIFAAMLAGYGSPVAAGWVAAHVDGIVGNDSLRLLLAAVLGGGMPTLWPALISLARGKLNGVKS